MIDPDSAVPVYWQVIAIRYMAYSYLHLEDREEALDMWFDEAFQEDHEYVVVSQKLRRLISPMAAMTLERLVAEADEWLLSRRATGREQLLT